MKQMSFTRSRNERKTSQRTLVQTKKNNVEMFSLLVFICESKWNVRAR